MDQTLTPKPKITADLTLPKQPRNNKMPNMMKHYDGIRAGFPANSIYLTAFFADDHDGCLN